MLLAVAAHVENKHSEREDTMSPPVVEVKRQPVVSSSPPTRGIPPVHQSVNNPAPARPPPDRAEDEDNDYDSDDASKDDLSFQTKPVEHECVSNQTLNDVNSSLSLQLEN